MVSSKFYKRIKLYIINPDYKNESIKCNVYVADKLGLKEIQRQGVLIPSGEYIG
jgi:hypothetical protein